MGICKQKISTQRARKRFGGNANNVDTIGKRLSIVEIKAKVVLNANMQVRL